MNIKIVSDGTSIGTHVINAVTGEEIAYCTRIKIDIDWKRPLVTADCTFLKVPVVIDSIQAKVFRVPELSTNIKNEYMN